MALICVKLCRERSEENPRRICQIRVIKGIPHPEFGSNATEFHVTLWNLNYGTDVVKEVANDTSDATKRFVKEPPQFTKEFVKAQRRIYKLISTNPQINITAIAENLGVSTRQVQKYLRRLTELHLIAREGGRKNGIWKILDKDYDDFTS